MPSLTDREGTSSRLATLGFVAESLQDSPGTRLNPFRDFAVPHFNPKGIAQPSQGPARDLSKLRAAS
jgi:hypothetical protein